MSPFARRLSGERRNASLGENPRMPRLSRVTYLSAAILVYGLLLVILFGAAHSVPAREQWPLVLVAVVAFLFLFLGEERVAVRGCVRVRHRVLPARGTDSHLTAGADRTAPESPATHGFQKIEDLSKLPPALAANPEFQKLFDRPGLKGVWVSTAPANERAPGPQANRWVSSLDELPAELAARPEIQKAFERGGGIWMRLKKIEGKTDMRSSLEPASEPVASRTTQVVEWTLRLILCAMLISALIALGSPAVGWPR